MRLMMCRAVSIDYSPYLLRVGPARDAQRLGEGQEDAARARGEGGDGGRQDGLGEHQGVGQAQRGFAEQRDDVVRDAVTQSGLDEAASEEEGEGDEPRDLAGEGAEGAGEGQNAQAHADAEADERGGAQGERLLDARGGRLTASAGNK